MPTPSREVMLGILLIFHHALKQTEIVRGPEYKLTDNRSMEGTRFWRVHTHTDMINYIYNLISEITMQCDHQISWLKKRSYTVTLLRWKKQENVCPDNDDAASFKIFTDVSRPDAKKGCDFVIKEGNAETRTCSLPLSKFCLVHGAELLSNLYATEAIRELRPFMLIRIFSDSVSALNALNAGGTTFSIV